MKRNRKKISLHTILFYIILASLICSIMSINYFRNKLGKGLIKCAEDEVEKITTIVMNNCLNKYIKNNNEEDLLNIKRNSQNEIELINYNTKNANIMTTTITKMLENDLAYMVKGEFNKINLDLKNISEDYYTKINDGVIFYVSTGSATGNSLLANIGPKIPLKLSLVENVSTNLSTKITEYGINNAMIEVFINLKANITINMPFLSKRITVKNRIPIDIHLIQGSIPSYYLGTK